MQTTAPTPAAAAVIERAAAQATIFAERPRRDALLALDWTWPTTPIEVSVQRNQPFEYVASVLRPFLAYAGWEPHVRYSEYDDALAMETDGAAAVELVWLDFGRYSTRDEELLSWLVDRLSVLRARTTAPILVTDWAAGGDETRAFNAGLRARAAKLPGVDVCDQAGLAAQLGADYEDERASAITGSRLSGVAAVHTARALGLQWIPAALGQRIKGVVVDLDDTLYEGVLAEDGLAGIRVSDEHLALQRDLLALRERGVFVAVASRNDPRDVDTLLADDGPLLLKASQLSGVVANWQSKADSVAEIAAALRVGTDAILLVDDNVGQLAEVGAQGGTQCLHAPDPAPTRRALALYPGLFRFETGDEDRLRVADVAAAARRAADAAAAGDPAAYLASLQARLTFALDPVEKVSRLHELSLKTNQFNTGLLRLPAADVARYVEDAERHAVTVALSDRLSDSGVIAAIFARRDGEELHVDEVAISCRALGRQLESSLVLTSVRRVLDDLPSLRVVFHWSPGPRNEPARQWLEETFGRPVTDSPVVVDRDVVDAWGPLAPCEYVWEEGNG